METIITIVTGTILVKSTGESGIDPVAANTPVQSYDYRAKIAQVIGTGDKMIAPRIGAAFELYTVWMR